MLKNCPIMLCSNALKCFNYASKNCYYAHIMLAYNIIHKQVALVNMEDYCPEGVLHFKQRLQC